MLVEGRRALIKDTDDDSANGLVDLLGRVGFTLLGGKVQ